MFYEILDKKRMSMLPLLKAFKKDFYLAGGTALALQIGHRDSIDFDFFSGSEFKTSTLFTKIKRVFKSHSFVKIQEEKNTLTVIVDHDIKLSFLYYPYALVTKPVVDKNLRLASVLDIACMKLSAIVGRATQKDYIDLYFILQKNKLNDIIKMMRKKMPELDENLVLKSLVYFKDLENEKIIFKRGSNVAFKDVEAYLKKMVKVYVL